MSDFTQAVTLTLTHEGGYVNNPADPGGATNMGITQRDLPNISIEFLTRSQAVVYYQQNFWPPLYDEITSQSVANKLFDMGVLFGLREAIMLMQIVVSQPTDGKFGPSTLAAVNGITDAVLLYSYKQRLFSHAENVVATKPQTQVFLQGWLNRINS